MLNVKATDPTAATHLYPVDTNVPQKRMPSLFKSANTFVTTTTTTYVGNPRSVRFPLHSKPFPRNEQHANSVQRSSS